MALTSDQITAQNFADFYQMILPYLNGNYRKLDYANAESIISLPYTAQVDGVAFLTVGKVSTPAVAVREFFVNGVYVATSCCSQTTGSSGYYYNTCQIPLAKGDQLTSTYSVFGTYIFVPYK